MWYVEYLLLHRDEIRATMNFDCDEYVDLISVEIAVNNLITNQLLSPEEIDVINFLLKDIPLKNEYSSRQYVKTFRSICTKISLLLGGQFTNGGYLTQLQDKYDLTDEQVKIAEKYMLSEYRYKVMKTPYKEN